MRLSRRYTSSDASPFAGVRFTTIDIDRPHSNPAERCCVTDFEVPADWSDQAAETLVTLYARQSGVPMETTPIAEKDVPEWLWRSAPAEGTEFSGEQSIKQILHRMVGAWTYAGWKRDYFDTPEDAKIFYDEWVHMLLHRIAAPSSAQWMHAGMHWAYGLVGKPQGHWCYDDETGDVIQSPDSYSHPQLHAGFIQGVDDELVAEGGILDLWTRETRGFKYGATTGSNLSSIRAEGEHLSNGEVSPGLLNFLSVGDRNAGAIRARSADKRTSKIAVVDMDHPDMPAFLRWKMEEEIKAAAMLCGMQHIVRHVQRVLQVIEQAREGCAFPCDVTQNPRLAHVVRQARRNSVPESVIAHTLQRAEQGFVEIELPAVGLVGPRSVMQDVAAHHSNLAVRIGGDFMCAAETDAPWEMRGRSNEDWSSSISSGGLLYSLAESIWASGAPSVQFADAINRVNTCPKSGAIQASTPSGDVMFLDDTATPLSTLNALAFLDKKGTDYDALLHAVQLLTLQLDITTSVAQYPSRRMAEQTLAHRPLGISLCNLAGYLMVQGIAYDSDQGRATLGALCGLVTGSAYHCSEMLALELGAFPAYGRNRSSMQSALKKQADATLSFARSLKNKKLAQHAERVWSHALVHGEQHGFRNAQTTLLAEMPMVMQLMDNATPAAEPMGRLLCSTSEQSGQRICHDILKRGLDALGYSAEHTAAISEYICGTGSLKDAPAIHHKALIAKGFEQEQLDLLEEALPGSSHIREAFDPWVLGESFCREQLGIKDDAMFDAEFDLLAYLGFKPEEIAEADCHACGSKNAAGAPHLLEKDIEVFACALQAGAPYNTILPEAHCAMLAAVGSTVSGGVYHEVKLPFTATIAEVEHLITEGYGLGLKSLNLHRLFSGVHMQSQFSEKQEEVLEEVTPRLVSLRKLHGPYRATLDQLKAQKNA